MGSCVVFAMVHRSVALCRREADPSANLNRTKIKKHTNPKRTMDALLAFLGVRTCDVVSYKRADLGQQQVERRFSAHLKAVMMR